MAKVRLDDTLDFSALDALNSSSTPRILRKNSGSNVEKPVKQIDEGDDHEPFNGDRAGSDYSVHLSALGLPSTSSTLNLERELVELPSDDIGGPSDFTLNMADWMNESRPKTTEADPSGLDVVQDLETTMNKHHKQPSVEDATTPIPKRSVDANAAEEGPADSLFRSSQCLPGQRESAQDIGKQMAALQARCKELEQSNSELRRLLANRDSNNDRETELMEQLRQERRIRESERNAADSAQTKSDRELDRAKARSEALQVELSNQRASMAQAQIDAELTQQELHFQIATWKQHANESRRKLAELSASEQSHSKPAETSSVDHVHQLESQLMNLKTSHQSELKALRDEYDGVAKDVDDFIVAKVKAREDHYAAIDSKRQAEISSLRSRNEELERLFTLCGKELMLSWGREEFGAPVVGAKQKYRYQLGRA